MTRGFSIGNVRIGAGSPVTIQSMTNTDTADSEETLRQIDELYRAGCEIVRVSVYDQRCARSVRTITDRSPIPVVADIHFDHRLAIAAIENGIAKVRINPGNIGSEDNIRKLSDALKLNNVPVRIGVNSGSLEKDILKKYGSPTAEALLESALRHARLVEKYGVTDIALSLKASDVKTTVEAYRLAHEKCDYPLHVGVTEAGGGSMGMMKSAIGIGTLLMEGIGDTIRVSLTDDPVREVEAGLEILRAAGLRNDFADIVSCPTCARTTIDVAGIARDVKEALRDIRRPVKVAVMGCVVNGPGEAREADIGIAGSKDGGVLFVKGEKPIPVKGDIKTALLEAIRRMPL